MFGSKISRGRLTNITEEFRGHLLVQSLQEYSNQYLKSEQDPFLLHTFHFIYQFVFGSTAPQWATASSFMRFLITHNDAPQSVRLLWTSDQLVAETSIWQRTTLTTDRHSCVRWDSNPQPQQASGSNPTPQTARSLGQTVHLSVVLYKRRYRPLP